MHLSYNQLSPRFCPQMRTLSVKRQVFQSQRECGIFSGSEHKQLRDGVVHRERGVAPAGAKAVSAQANS